MLYLKQSTAATIKLGPFVDDSDGKTAETELTISQADIRLSKNGGDIAQTNNSAGATHDELGYYNVPLDTTDTNTLGTLKVIVSKSGALPVFADFMVITAEAYDTLCGTDHFTVDLNGTPSVNVVQISGDSTAADNLESYCDGTTAQPVNVTQIGGTAQSATDLKDFADTGYDPTTHKVQGVVLTDTCTTNTDMRGTDNAYTGTPPTVTAIRQEMDTNSTRLAAILTDTGTTLDGKLDAIAGYLDTEVAAILEDTGTTIPGLINALNDLSAQDVWEYVTRTLTSAGSGGATAQEVWEYATRTLTANTNLNIPSAADIADAVWDEAIADHTTGTTFGGKNQRVVPSETLNDYKADVSGLATSAALAIVDGNVDSILEDTNELQTNQGNWLTATGFSTHSAEDVWSVATRSLTDKAGFTISGTKTTLDALNDISSGDVSTACGTALTSYDPPTATEMASAFTEIKGATWSSATDTLEHIRDKQSDIEADTQDLQTQIGTDGAGLTNIPWNSAWDAEVQSECTDALNAYDPPTATEMNARTLPSASYATAAALSTHDGKLDTVDTVVDGIQADLSNATDGLGALKALLDQIVSDLESAYTDATSLTTNSLRDRIRTLGWIIRNKMEVTNANGNTVIYKDDGTTPAFSVPSAITDDSTTTTRKRME
jgi:hypothetical protein